MRGGEGFYSQGRAPIQGRKRRLSGDWCPRAPCRHLIGRLGCRPASGTCLRHFSGHVEACPDMPDLARPFTNIPWIMEKARVFQKNIYFCFIDYAKAFDCVHHNKLENSSRDGNTRPPNLPLEKSVFRSRSNS